ncbi:unnamed protein product [Mytilus edulis]|uniref:Uncharacterized protein n=1 Tax=Mytilus edulis TaxID=6550 RepID=A0A8S3TCX4_MYTED|nr:unnamed protein product [Mytilus edulis]
MGKPCIPCPENWYGHVCFCNVTAVDYKVNTIEASTIEKEFEEDETGISKRDLLIYSGSVTGTILIIGLYYCYNKNRRKTDISSTSANINDSPPPENAGFGNESFEMNESIYHTIDENTMVNLVQQETPYLEVVDESSNSDKLTSSSESMKSSNSSTSDYLHPYHSFIASSNDRSYEQMQPFLKPKITDDQYQECVTPLENMTDKVNHPQGITNQVIKVCVHEGEKSSLD